MSKILSIAAPVIGFAIAGPAGAAAGGALAGGLGGGGVKGALLGGLTGYAGGSLFSGLSGGGGMFGGGGGLFSGLGAAGPTIGSAPSHFLSGAGSSLGGFSGGLSGGLSGLGSALKSGSSFLKEMSPYTTLLGGVMDMRSNSAMAKDLRQLAQSQDAYGPYRGQTAGILSGLVDGSRGLESVPGGTGALSYTEDAFKRAQAARGRFNAGSYEGDLARALAPVENQIVTNTQRTLSGLVGNPQQGGLYNERAITLENQGYGPVFDAVGQTEGNGA